VLGTLQAPPTPAFLALVRRGRMGGVLLLGNGWSPAVMAATTAELQRAACATGEPFLVAADQEGGLVRRLSWAPPSVAPAQMPTAAMARGQARAAAAALRSAGVDVDLAPVADTPGSSRSFLGSRAFSRKSWLVAPLAAAFVDGLQQSGIAATAKHFPGLGRAGANTDLKAVTIGASAATLRRGLLPFRKAIAAGVQLVMISSAAYPALDPSRLPAVFSSRIATGLLRDQLGFTGVAVSDALDAPAGRAVSHAATRALAAGVDLLLFGSERSSEQAYATLVSDAAKYPHLRARLAESAQRVRSLKAWLSAAGGPSCPAR
jgi:beta-N-acetylhexosaminidase